MGENENGADAGGLESLKRRRGTPTGVQRHVGTPKRSIHRDQEEQEEEEDCLPICVI